VTIVGTAIHHLIDLAISMVILRIVQPLLAPIMLTGIRLR
jgi:hypothetical protein